jgi:peptide deformylase
MLRPIVKYGERILNDKAAVVEAITADVDRVIDDMVKAMHAAPGIGLAAPQIGVSLRICIVDLSVGRRAEDLRVMINPEFVEREGTQLEEEGCLSLPGFTATVLRPRRATIRALDREGREHFVEGKELLARALQHEVDHLDGTLFVDRVRGIKRRHIVGQIQKLRRAGRW